MLFKKSIEITCKYEDNRELTNTFVAPSSYLELHDKSVLSVDCTDGGLGVSSGIDGSLVVWECETGEIRVIMKAILLYYFLQINIFV